MYKDPDNAPQLVSEMTNEQYLDAISCPRIDPIKQGEKVMPKSEELFAESETESKQDEESNAETVGEVKDDEDDGEWETLPVGAIRPPEFRRERLLEQICRAICCKPEKEQDMRERRFKQLAVSNPKWATCSFLFPSDRSYIYYKWRLAENRAGRGIPVEYD